MRLRTYRDVTVIAILVGALAMAAAATAPVLAGEVAVGMRVALDVMHAQHGGVVPVSDRATFVVSAPSVGRVVQLSDQVLFEARAPGAVTVEARYAETTRTFEFTVVPATTPASPAASRPPGGPPLAVVAIEIEPIQVGVLEVGKGYFFPVSARVRYAGVGHPVREAIGGRTNWSCSLPELGTFDGPMFIAKKAGEVELTARFAGASDAVTIRIR